MVSFICSRIVRVRLIISFLKAIIALITSIFVALTSFQGHEVPSVSKRDFAFTYLEYPAEAVKTLGEWGITEAQWKSRADAGTDVFVDAQGYTDINGIVISPYYTARINGTEIPVYASTVFVGTT